VVELELGRIFLYTSQNIAAIRYGITQLWAYEVRIRVRFRDLARLLKFGCFYHPTPKGSYPFYLYTKHIFSLTKINIYINFSMRGACQVLFSGYASIMYRKGSFWGCLGCFSWNSGSTAEYMLHYCIEFLSIRPDCLGFLSSSYRSLKHIYRFKLYFFFSHVVLFSFNINLLFY